MHHLERLQSMIYLLPYTHHPTGNKAAGCVKGWRQSLLSHRFTLSRLCHQSLSHTAPADILNSQIQKNRDIASRGRKKRCIYDGLKPRVHIVTTVSFLPGGCLTTKDVAVYNQLLKYIFFFFFYDATYVCMHFELSHGMTPFWLQPSTSPIGSTAMFTHLNRQQTDWLAER